MGKSFISFIVIPQDQTIYQINDPLKCSHYTVMLSGDAGYTVFKRLQWKSLEYIIERDEILYRR